MLRRVSAGGASEAAPPVDCESARVIGQGLTMRGKPCRWCTTCSRSAQRARRTAVLAAPTHSLSFRGFQRSSNSHLSDKAPGAGPGEIHCITRTPPRREDGALLPPAAKGTPRQAAAAARTATRATAHGSTAPHPPSRRGTRPCAAKPPPPLPAAPFRSLSHRAQIPPPRSPAAT